MKLGKKSARQDKRTLKLSQFVGDVEVPDSLDWFSGIKSWGMMRNDDVGDCTYAALGHFLQAQSAATGCEYTVSDDVVIAGYSALTGYNPKTGENDNGAVELDVLNWFRQNGFGGKQLLAYADPDISNPSRVKQAIRMFGGLYIGLQLPASAQGQKVWDVETGPDSDPGSWGGHAVIVLGYDAKTLTCVTWGELKPMTWAFWNKYCDEAHALLLDDWARYASADFKLGDLQQALAAIA